MTATSLTIKVAKPTVPERLTAGTATVDHFLNLTHALNNAMMATLQSMNSEKMETLTTWMGAALLDRLNLAGTESTTLP